MLLTVASAPISSNAVSGQFPSSRRDARNVTSANGIYTSSVRRTVSGRRSFDMKPTTKTAVFSFPMGTWWFNPEVRVILFS
jgi:hypothetical protein